MMFRFFGVVETVAILAIMNLADFVLAWRVWAMARRALPWNASELARVHDDIRGNLERGNLSDVDVSATAVFTRDDPDEHVLPHLPEPSAVPWWMQEDE